VSCRLYRLKTDYYENETTGRPAHQACPEYPWCEATLKDVGPDGIPVDREHCVAGRRCFSPEQGPAG
jgi:hypothetical protein